MRDISEAVFELLEEIDDICKENNIEYCVEDTVARDGYLSNSIKCGSYEANVSMDTENIRKFYKVMESFSKEGRYFESISNTKNKRAFVARYLNTNSFYMNLRKPYQAVNKCIRVNIHLRQNKYDNPNKAKARKLQIAWKCRSNSFRVLYKNIVPCALMKVRRELFGELKVGGQVLEKWLSYNEAKINFDDYYAYLEDHEINPDNILPIIKNAFEEKRSTEEGMKMSELSNYDDYSIVRRKLPMLVINGKQIPAFLYDELSTVTINGRQFPVPKEIELYLWFCLGISAGFNPNADVVNENVIASEVITYSEFRRKNDEYFRINRSLTRFASRERYLRGVIRLPITRMFREFERTFYSPAESVEEEENVLPEI